MKEVRQLGCENRILWEHSIELRKYPLITVENRKYGCMLHRILFFTHKTVIGQARIIFLHISRIEFLYPHVTAILDNCNTQRTKCHRPSIKRKYVVKFALLYSLAVFMLSELPTSPAFALSEYFIWPLLPFTWHHYTVPIINCLLVGGDILSLVMDSLVCPEP